MSKDKDTRLRHDGVLPGPGKRDEAFEPPLRSAVEPVQRSLDDTIQFDCHKGVACYNACCRGTDVQLTPYDILRLRARLGASSSEFVARYTIPFEMDGHGLPGLKLAVKPDGRECVFLEEGGCGVYEDRPAACRYYALGSMGVRRTGEGSVTDVYFVVREPYCLGHDEPRRLTVRDYRREQGIEKYDDMNREWRDAIIKKRSGGPSIGKPSARSLQLFDMCSYDLDSFRDFMGTPGFRDAFDLSDEERDAIAGDDERLLAFAVRFMRQALYGEGSIPVKEGVRERRLARRKALRARAAPGRHA